jgi:hypothetical protein
MTQPKEVSLDSDSTQLVVASTAKNQLQEHCKIRNGE